MRPSLLQILLLVAFALPHTVFGQAAADPDGITLQPIPDRLVVLTFDDAPASHATVVAPILKSLDFGGTIYVCDFDSFRTRKDWYLSYRQMQTMAKAGFEIGNHTMGHGGSLSAFLAMENALLAHGCPKPTTVCWPVYAAAPSIYPALAEHGYSWGRGGYERPYRPTVDNPFDVPSFTIKDGTTLETFIKQAQQACQGRVVVYCFHGVPDMEHPGVSLEPATFQVMMRYLKDNKYRCIAMRDLAQYIDPVKAAKLPQTKNAVVLESPFLTLKDDKPYIAAAIVAPQSEPPPKAVIHTEKNIWSFAVPGATLTDIAGTSIGVSLPKGGDQKSLAPTFTVSPSATATPTSGTSRDFTLPQNYTVRAADGSSRVFTVTVVTAGEPRLCAWSGPGGGNWSDAAHWSGGLMPETSTSAGQQSLYALDFSTIAKCSVSNDLKGYFSVCRLVLGEGGEGLVLNGNSIEFGKNPFSGFPPVISIGKNRRRLNLDVPVVLASDLHVQTVNSGDPDSLIAFKGVVSGSGAIVLNSYGEPQSARINGHDAHFGILQFENSNTYSGGTIINGGKVLVMKDNGLGTGTVTLNDFGTLAAHARISNAVIINQGRLCDSTCEGPITLHSVADFYGDCRILADISGPGSFTMLGKIGNYLGMIPGGTVTLGGTCTYAGPTTLFPGTLLIQKAVGLYNGDAAKWTPHNIVVHAMATLRLNVGGKDEFTGEQVGVLLHNLTTDTINNGLMGGSWVCLDTTHASGSVTLSTDFCDSTGPCGGPITLRKCGAGVLQFTGANSYSGRTYLEGGTLAVTSFNSIEKPKPTSSLGAPTTLEDGMIDVSGDCTLIYAGKGETTDRILDLNGQKQILTLDQSGSGMLTFTSPFEISGFGFMKTIVLQGSGTGSGELAAALSDPHDDKKEASLALTKNGTGDWILSGVNRYSGPTQVTQGRLILGNAQSLGPQTDLSVAAGAAIVLRFNGRMRVATLLLDGRPQPSGTYSEANAPQFIQGTGSLECQ